MFNRNVDGAIIGDDCQRAYIYNDSWGLDCERRTLSNGDVELALTSSEMLILQDFVKSGRLVHEKADILAVLSKDQDAYTGLVMCISRLQAKFRKVSGGAGLFRSVRNRGYCLVKNIELIR